MPDTSLLQNIQLAAEEINFPSAVAFEQLKLESGGFRPDVIYGPFVGGAGERGLAQFIPATWARFGDGDPYNPYDSLRAWQRYTKYLANLFDNDLRLILQAYNGGEGNVQRGTVSNAARNYADKILRNAGNNELRVENNYYLPTSLPENSLSNLSLFGLSPVASILIGAALLGVTVALLRNRI